MRFVTLGRLAATATVGALALTACGGGSAGAGGGLSGRVEVDGSSTVGPLTSVAAQKFMRKHPGARVTVAMSGTGGGFEKFCRGETDINNASRKIAPAEKQLCRKNGIGYERFTVALDALTVVVNQQNTWAKCLTIQQLKKIWKPGSKVDSWDDIKPSYPKVDLQLFGPGTDSGTFDYFTRVVVGKAGKSRSDYAASENDNVLVQGVAGSKGGLGYFGYSYFENNQDKLNAVAIDSGQGCVQPSPQAASTGRYEPLTRPLYIYPKLSSLRQEKTVRSFVTFYLENAQQIAKLKQFIPFSDTTRQAQLAKLRKVKK